jgi:hypothetical protein
MSSIELATIVFAARNGMRIGQFAAYSLPSFADTSARLHPSK